MSTTPTSPEHVSAAGDDCTGRRSAHRASCDCTRCDRPAVDLNGGCPAWCQYHWYHDEDGEPRMVVHEAIVKVRSATVRVSLGPYLEPALVDLPDGDHGQFIPPDSLLHYAQALQEAHHLLVSGGGMVSSHT